jgi:hypothetical protein
MNDDTEPFVITNPSRKFYKFLFRVRLDEETAEMANSFVDNWLADKGWSIKRQKIVNLPLQGMFQIRTWLN